MKHPKKNAPKLPRFKVPKSMTSKVFIDKKTKLRQKRIKTVDITDD